VTAPEPATVTAWAEAPGARSLPGVLRVLVGGQHVGAIFRDDSEPSGPWIAQVHGLRPSPSTSHPHGRRGAQRRAGVLVGPRARRPQGVARHLVG